MTAIQHTVPSQTIGPDPSLYRSPLKLERRPVPALTGLRFLAASYVIFYHSHVPQLLLDHHLVAEGHFLSNGHYAVLLFFLLSGFILSYTYEGKIESPGQRRRFWEARFSRIWPLYAFSLLVSTLVDHTTPSAGKAFATLFMLQSWSPWNIQMAGAWNFVCWTLSVEAFFYLVFPLIQRVIERRNTHVQIVLLSAFVLLSVAIRTGAHTFGVAAVGPYRYVPLAVLRLPDFIIGICLGNLFLRQRRTGGRGLIHTSVPWFSGPLTWLAIAISVFLFCHAEGWWPACTPVSLALLLMGLASEQSLPQRLLSSKALLLGGQISYAMYLLQWPCKIAVNKLFDYVAIASTGARFAMWLIVLIAVSAASFYAIEQPARDFFRDLFRRANATA